MSETATPESEAPEPEAPSPADLAPKAEEPKDEPKPARTAEQLEAELAKVRRESAGYRTKLREAEPVLKAAQEAEEAKKGEAQREREAREQAERERDEERAGNKRLRLGLKYGIPEGRVHLIPQGSDEDMEANAAHLGELYASTAKTAPPPSDRPVEGLRPGASPEPPKPVDNSYPPNWGRPRPRAS